MRKKDAALRVDGLETRKALIEAAGELAAEYGWQQVLARDVCAKAGVNASSINYWFGSRNGLYSEVLHSIPTTFLADEAIDEVLAERDPEAALRKILAGYSPEPDGRKGWRLRLWAREIFGSTTASFSDLVQGPGVARFRKVKRIMSLYLGLPAGDIRVECCILMAFSAISLTEMISPAVRSNLFPGIYASPAAARAFGTEYVMKSLENFRRSLGKEGGYPESPS